MFAYCKNNPVNNRDSSGNAAETVLDVISFGMSIADVIARPDDPWAWAALAGDAIDIAIPFVAGVGEAIKTVNAARKTADVVDDTYDAIKASGNALDFLDGICFVEGTQISTETGNKAIEQIQCGDLVWAWDEKTGDVALKKVVETYVNETTELTHILVNGEEIISTLTHPFYSPVKGWTEACRLRAGDILVTVNGEYVVVEQIQHEILEKPIAVYNFQVEDYHTYYIGSEGILVHNSCSMASSLPLDGTQMNSSDALQLAEDFLGRGYSELSPGRFVSGDSYRQVRLTDSDLSIINNHAGAPHFNFELLVANPSKPGKNMIVANSHIFVYD